MQINADQKDGKYTLTLSGAPAGSVVEVRFQNTINGAQSIETVDVGSDGKAVVNAPQNYGQNFKVELVVLTEEGDNTHSLSYAPIARGDQSGNFVLVTSDSALLAQQAQNASPAPASARAGVAPGAQTGGQTQSGTIPSPTQ